jgi:hypothetical protein
MIRAHKRFAVCRKASLRKQGRRGVDGLLIELSLDGCRVSNVSTKAGFALDEHVVVRVPGTGPIEARIRWLREGTVGLRFVRPLHIPALDELIRLCRAAPETAEPLQSYGT